MRPGGRLLRILPRLLAILAATVLCASAVGFFALRSLYYGANRRALSETVRALANGVSEESLKNLQRAQAFCVQSARGTSFRVTLIDARGQVLGDSDARPEDMENHGGRPEIQGALRGLKSVDLRRSATTGVVMIYAAEPLGADDRVEGVLRIALALPELRSRLVPFYLAAASATLLLLGATALASVRLERRASLPVAEIAQTAATWAAGDLERRIGKLTPEEMDRLGRTLNAMAADLSERIALDARRGRELQTILDSIGEAVIAVDGEHRVRLVNPAARRLASSSPDLRLEGLPLLAAFRSTEMEAATERCVATGERVEAEFALYRDPTSHFLLCAAPLALSVSQPGHPASEGNDSPDRGVVLVLNDITTLRRLEQVRRDFVANVSHELKTPITLIKGFVETLQDGAMRDPEEAERFLGIVGKHADRMDALLDDLLTLARLERPDAPPLRKEPVDIGLILDDVAQTLEPKRAARGSKLVLSCPEGLSAMVNESLLEQAVLNLADNALKYSPNGSRVDIQAREEEGFLVIRVKDSGPGIPARHLQRIFERFYRVDKARSREEGGTGLGLAIVRHIALAHGGKAEASSREGEGSTFTLRVPIR